MNDMRDVTSKVVLIIADEIQALSHEHHNYAFMLRGFADQHDYHMQRADALQRVIDEARGQEPVGWMYRLGAEQEKFTWTRAPLDKFNSEHPELPQYQMRPLYSAPVPAQPSADSVCPHCLKIVGEKLARRCAATGELKLHEVGG